MKFSVLMLILCFFISGLNTINAANDLLSVTFTFKSSYDNNILTYSDRDRERFENGTELHVSPTSTLDDIRNDFKLSLDSKFKLTSKHYTRLYVVTNFAGYLANSIKNFGWISMTARQDVFNKFRLSGNYFYEPRYFIRDYNDVNSGTRQHCEFAQSQWKGELRYRPTKSWEFTGIGRFKRYAYNEYFTEYDSDFQQFGLGVVHRLGNMKFTGGYHLTVNDNIGFDESELLTFYDEDNESGNGDYEQDEYEIGLRYRFKMVNRTTDFTASAVLADRYYSTDQSPESDPIHHGRRDVYLTTEVGLDHRLTNLIGLAIGFQHKSRRSRASDDIVGRVKNYDRWLGYFEASYELW